VKWKYRLAAMGIRAALEQVTISTVGDLKTLLALAAYRSVDRTSDRVHAFFERVGISLVKKPQTHQCSQHFQTLQQQ
jgi:hypothetical protein